MIAPSLPLAIVSDFDGTIITTDVGDVLCMRRAPEAYREFDRDWRGGRISLVEGQRRIWPKVRVTREEFLAFVDEIARFRDGFERFRAAAAARGIPFVIASNGFSNYIERILARPEAGAAPKAVYANRLDFEGDRIVAAFPFLERYGCGACAICKGRIVDDLKAQGFRVAFMGDGGSDRCAAGHADELFAVAGASFERYLRERAIAHRAFEGFDEVGEALGILSV